jgi:hypothetical protein
MLNEAIILPGWTDRARVICAAATSARERRSSLALVGIGNIGPSVHAVQAADIASNAWAV